MPGIFFYEFQVPHLIMRHFLDYRSIVSVSVKIRSGVMAKMRSVIFWVSVSSENRIIGIVKAGMIIAGIIVAMPNGVIEVRWIAAAAYSSSLRGYGKTDQNQKAH